MRRFKVVAMICLTACLGAAGFEAFALQKPDDQAARPSAARWRYQSVRLLNESQLDVTANKQGEKGWEVVEVVPVLTGASAPFSMRYTMLFRRSADLND